MRNNWSQALGFAGDGDDTLPVLPPLPPSPGFFAGLANGVVWALCFKGDCAVLDIGAEYVGHLVSSCGIGRCGERCAEPKVEGSGLRRFLETKGPEPVYSRFHQPSSSRAEKEIPPHHFKDVCVFPVRLARLGGPADHARCTGLSLSASFRLGLVFRVCIGVRVVLVRRAMRLRIRIARNGGQRSSLGGDCVLDTPRPVKMLPLEIHTLLTPRARSSAIKTLCQRLRDHIRRRTPTPH